MKKNVKRNLLKSLFLTGTILIISACNSSMDNDLKSLSQKVERKICEVEIKQSSKEKKYEDKLIKKIDKSIKALGDVPNADTFIIDLNNIKNSISQITNKQKREGKFLDLKNKIDFKFEKDSDNNVNFSCGKVFIKNISSDPTFFLSYCKFAKGVMDVVGLEDDYKIDVSHVKQLSSYGLKTVIPSPKKYLANKVFYFDVDNEQNILAGWGKAEKISIHTNILIENLFSIYDINPDFFDKNFDFKQVELKNVRFLGDSSFYVDFNFKGIQQKNIFVSSCSKLVKFFDLNSFRLDDNKIFLLDSNGNNSLEMNYKHLESFLKLIIDKKIQIKNKLNISLKKDEISVDTQGVSMSNFYKPRLDFEATTYLNHLECLRTLKDHGLINIQTAKLTLGDELKIGDFDLLKFQFSESNGKNFKLDDVYKNVNTIFQIFNIDCFVCIIRKNGKRLIKISRDGNDYFYKFEKNGFLKKV